MKWQDYNLFACSTNIADVVDVCPPFLLLVVLSLSCCSLFAATLLLESKLGKEFANRFNLQAVVLICFKGT